MREVKLRGNTSVVFHVSGISAEVIHGFVGSQEQILPAADVSRYEIKVIEWKTKLMVHNLSQDDSGLYYCGAVYAIGTSMSHVELKVSRG